MKNDFNQTRFRLDKYQSKLSLDGNKIYSYETHVGNILPEHVEMFKFYSKATSTHVNYVGEFYGKKVIRLQN
tara:strand:- start:376 stop:591 length:216 start_codon:yes stop_codon:yes gene_type:complete